MMGCFAKKLNTKGISLLETTFTIAIFTTAILIVGNFVTRGYQTIKFTQEQNTAIKEAQKGIKTMVKEIREARTGDNGAYALVKADDQEFIFYSDIDQDNDIERVRYFLNGTDFIKGVIEPSGNPITYIEQNEATSTLSQYVQNGGDPIFYYYNGDWPGDIINNPLPTPSRLVDTKLMRVYLKINITPDRSPTYFELESSTQIRNLKTNL